tara:strand:- start:584 stop:733 length:150 start_codon:yes stop_codon:yes gene_type:complete
MQWFPREKHKIDFFALATRKEKNRWLEKIYLICGIGFFGYAFYHLFFGP